MGERNAIVSAYAMYRHIEQYSTPQKNDKSVIK